MIPFCRVSWIIPDNERRAAAAHRLDERRRRRQVFDLRDKDASWPGDMDDPDLNAVTIKHGVLMSETVYVPGHLQPVEIQGSLPPRHTRIIGPRWICLVATKTGTTEMDPRDLTVTGLWVPGEPLEPDAP